MIDALGSVVKVVTGNLDDEDAKQYDKTLSYLKINQKEISTVLNKQFSLNEHILEPLQNSHGSLF